jgi:hypothetical protein
LLQDEEEARARALLDRERELRSQQERQAAEISSLK